MNILLLRTVFSAIDSDNKAVLGPHPRQQVSHVTHMYIRMYYIRIVLYFVYEKLLKVGYSNERQVTAHIKYDFP